MTTPHLDENTELTIIIVDDSHDDHFFIKESLSHFKKIHFLDYYNGEDFLDFLEEESRKNASKPGHPIIVILDVNMPKLSGFEVFEIVEARNLKNHMRFFILTTSVTEIEKRNCRKYGLDCHQKPFLIDDFTKLMEKIIRDCQK